MPTLASIIMAAGKGTRMKSDLPKVLIPVLEKPMLSWVLDALKDSGVNKHCIIVGGETNSFIDLLSSEPDLTICEQLERKGTGDAVASAVHSFETTQSPAPFTTGRHLSGEKINASHVIICAGDTPNISSEVIRDFIESSQDSDLSILAAKIPDPFGYGRVVLENGSFKCITEEKDADEATKKIDLINTGTVFGKTDVVFSLLSQLTPLNAQNEYYLTDIFENAVKQNKKVTVYTTHRWQSFAGVNTPEQLRSIETTMRGK